MARQMNQLAIVALVVGLCGAFAACSSDDDSTPTIGNGGASGKGGAGGSTSHAGSAGKANNNGGDAGSTPTPGGGDAGTSPNGGSAGVPDQPDETAGAGGEAGAMTETCSATTPAGCFCGKPKLNADFLNQCTAHSCIKFDNAAHNIPATLPALP